MTIFGDDTAAAFTHIDDVAPRHRQLSDHARAKIKFSMLEPMPLFRNELAQIVSGGHGLAV